MSWQKPSLLDTFLNDLDEKECKLLVFMLADLKPHEFDGELARYDVNEQALIGRMKDALERLQAAGEMPSSKYEL